MPPFATDQLRKIFIGGLNLDTTEEGLKEYFSRWGECIDVVVMRFPDTKRSRGFGFVTYEKGESVDAVLNAKPHTLDGKDIEPKRAVAKEETSHSAREEAEKCKKIFVGGLASATTEDDIRECFTKFCEEAGHGRVEEVLIMRDRENNDRLRGFCFVTFDGPEIVDKVCSVKYFEIRTKTVEVRRAESRMAMKKKEEKDFGYRRRVEDRRRDMSDSYQGSGKMRGNFFGSGYNNQMGMQGSMSGGGGGGMPFFGGGNGGGARGGSGNFGGGGYNMNPMVLAGMMNMLASSMGMNMSGGMGGGMGNMGGGMGSMGSGMGNMGMNAMGGDGMGGQNRSGGDSGYNTGDSFRGSSTSSGGYVKSDNVNAGNSASSDAVGSYGGQNPNMYNEQTAASMGDISGYANAMSAMFGAAGVTPANVQAALYSAYGGGKSDYNQLGAYNDQSPSMYGPSRNMSTGKAAGTNRGYKPY